MMVCLLAVVIAAMAQTPREDFKRDRNIAGSNHYAYPTPTEKLTPCPKGYEPVYFSHYGRHGSRYHIGAIYTRTEERLAKAERLGVLTEKGKDVLQKVRMLREEGRKRDGELTELGALQHRQIAERMYKNFPQIFSKPIHIDAKSTVVIRCILSMENALQQLKSMNPKLDIRHDASEHDMWYMNQPDQVLEKLKYKSNENGKFSYKHTHPERLMSVLFTEEGYWKYGVDSQSLMHDLFDLANNLQSSELAKEISLWDLFTDEEVYDLWTASNVFWYIAYGPSKYSGGVQPYSQRNLLRKIITEADSCLAAGEVTAHLRYGHDTMVLPLTCLLDLDGAGQQHDDLETLADHWQNYKIFPMGCNIQFVFYRPLPNKKAKASRDLNGDILVKVLLNEHETHLPLATDSWPYYRWSDVRAYYLNKLDSYENNRQND